jgi:hypothetical protein
MALRASLKRRLKRVEACSAKALQKEAKVEEEQHNRTCFEPQTDKVDQPFRLLGLPIELLLQILEILLSATPVKSSCHRYPLVSLRL